MAKSLSAKKLEIYIQREEKAVEAAIIRKDDDDERWHEAKLYMLCELLREVSK